jgi:hypothetical protein
MRSDQEVGVDGDEPVHEVVERIAVVDVDPRRRGDLLPPAA